MIAALFVETNGVYAGLEAVDVWGVERDARLYHGPYPVVAHPPCHLWVNLAAVNWKRYQRERPAWYPDGCDGGCFDAALAAVRRYGGVLEHPAGSWAWQRFDLPRPTVTGWIRSPDDAWACEVWQSAYGHQARKRTWLLYVGKARPFDLNWRRAPGVAQVGWFDRIKPTLSKKATLRTPPDFALELVRLAVHSRSCG